MISALSDLPSSWTRTPDLRKAVKLLNTTKFGHPDRYEDAVSLEIAEAFKTVGHADKMRLHCAEQALKKRRVTDANWDVERRKLLSLLEAETLIKTLRYTGLIYRTLKSTQQHATRDLQVIRSMLRPCSPSCRGNARRRQYASRT